MRKFLLCILLLTLTLTGCGAESKVELTSTAEYDGCTLELGEAETFTSDDGKLLIKVSAIYTNTNDEPLYAYCSFAVRAFQHDTEITDCSDINGTESSLIREIKAGKSIQVQYVFALTDESEVEVLIGTPTADQETIAKRDYLTLNSQQ